MKETTKISRRLFFSRVSSALAGITILPSYLALGKADALGNLPPSKRINLACIGVGGRAKTVIPQLCSNGAAKPVAFCDVDFNRASKEVMDTFPEVRRFTDFRVMLDQMGDDVDAVSVVTPDHTHFVQTIDAMQRGKHVYVEKPLTHSFREATLLIQAEKRYGVVTQMGNQGHTSPGARQFQQLQQAGALEDIVKIEAYKDPSLWFMDATQRISEFPKAEPIPSSLNYDLWCGPAKMMPFSGRYHPFDWRAFYIYGNGMLGDWGAHIIDFAHNYLKLGLPTEVEPLRLDDYNQVIFPLSSHIRMQFPERGTGLPACEILWRDGSDAVPVLDQKYHSSDASGNLVIPRLGRAGTVLHRKDEQFVIQRGSHGSVSRLYPRASMMDYKRALKAPSGGLDHMQSFIQSCMGNGKTTSPFSVGGPLTQLLMLGVIAQYLNEGFNFDRDTERITNNKTANALLEGPKPRKGWERYYAEV
ncbi:MAG: Gfo/Idh/MocA family oxidoreductase [Verrucomicrobiota bacterium]|nr:Gfo/Idh/MocA family oxidoreductase [Verrucomicrobiota bacterium]MEC7487280.1 Gfo/Idh/MocA family oxidoreductase [Verrucomicrobiota bacterium]MEC8333064.1 Gfo/Idh/MocA family oxidoreductase [Verrucomicrobiota bacterium]MEC9228485.1 Gfo/Idh/MocA family oxidoreductase [Verrucomicrobiota bacterium]